MSEGGAGEKKEKSTKIFGRSANDEVGVSAEFFIERPKRDGGPEAKDVVW